MFRNLFDRSTITKIALKRIRRQCKRDGDEEACDKIDAILAHEDSDAMLAMLGMEMERQAIPPNDIVLADGPEGQAVPLSGDDEESEDGPFLRFFKYLVENHEKVLAFISKLIALFAVLLCMVAFAPQTSQADEFDCFVEVDDLDCMANDEVSDGDLFTGLFMNLYEPTSQPEPVEQFTTQLAQDCPGGVCPLPAAAPAQAPSISTASYSTIPLIRQRIARRRGGLIARIVGRIQSRRAMRLGW